MTEAEAGGRALAGRAASQADLSRDELRYFGAWLLDVMSRLMLVQDDEVIAVQLRQLAREAFYSGLLTAPQQQLLGRWVLDELDALRRRDRRSASRGAPLPGGRRASDRHDYSPMRAAHLQELDDFFTIGARLDDEGCEHGVRPAKACTYPGCKGRRAQLAWEALT